MCAEEEKGRLSHMEASLPLYERDKQRVQPT